MNKEDLRIVIFGTSDFGCPTVDVLMMNDYNIVGIITKPDVYNVRKKQNIPTPMKEKAMERGIPVLMPTDLKDEKFLSDLKKMDGNVFVVIAFQMLPKEVFEMPKYGTFNIHASTLPDYRGAAPINWAIANGEKRIGMTSFFINEKMDDGKIIYQTSIPNYSNRNFTQLYDILKVAVCGNLCCETLNKIVESNGNPITLTQDPSRCFHKAPKLNHENTKLDLTKNIDDIFNHIKAFSLKPGAWCLIQSEDKFNEKSIKILGGEIISFGHHKGFERETAYFSIVDGNILMFAGDGCIKVTMLQLEGSKVMTPKDFINGYGDFLEKWMLV